MTDMAMALQWERISAGCAAKATWASRRSFAALPEPLCIRAKPAPASGSSSGILPAAMHAASLSATRSAGPAQLKRAAAAGSSPPGASSSPAFTSSSNTFAACFCAPRPRSPARIRSSSFSMLGWIAFWIFGAPPAVFQAPLAYRFTEASPSYRMRNTRTRMASRVSLLEQSSVVSRSWPNFLCSRILSMTLPRSMAALSRTTCCRFRSSGESPCNVAT
mmetsp:Transcript_95454/g.265237  ORF Transcript_95454/g.265237 Transcript_95454/m.265237 type:complete len:219 (-) Transcript_95454:28-684(-)